MAAVADVRFCGRIFANKVSQFVFRPRDSLLQVAISLHYRAKATREQLLMQLYGIVRVSVSGRSRDHGTSRSLLRQLQHHLLLETRGIFLFVIDAPATDR